MNKRFFLLRVFGFPVYLEASFLLLVAFYLFMGGLSAAELAGTAVFVLAATASILWHELGHALMARRQGSSSISIVLHGAGGLTSHSPLATLRRALLVSAAGPGIGLALGLALLGGRALGRAAGLALPPQLGWLLENLININIVWSLFNLLPMLPLDGGNILQDLLLMRLPRRRAIELSLATSFLLAVGLGVAALLAVRLGVAALANNWIFVTLICLFSGQLTYQQMGGLGPVRRFFQNLRS